VQSKGKAKQHQKKRPSEVNHGNIAPTIRDQGITAESITLRWALPLAAIRRLKFGGAECDSAGQAYVAAVGRCWFVTLGLVACWSHPVRAGCVEGWDRYPCSPSGRRIPRMRATLKDDVSGVVPCLGRIASRACGLC
jgi:hypothetical protein